MRNWKAVYQYSSDMMIQDLSDNEVARFIFAKHAHQFGTDMTNKVESVDWHQIAYGLFGVTRQEDYTWVGQQTNQSYNSEMKALLD